MFHQDIAQKRLDKAEKKLKFRPAPHSIKDVETANRHLESLTQFNDHGSVVGWKRPLEPDEQRHIQNEIAMCMCDFVYWLTRYAYIRYANETVARMQPNIAQKIIIDIWADNEKNGRSNLLIELKARQLGVSTISELAVCHKCVFFPNVNAIVASCDPGKSELMAKMIELAFDMMPHWIKPNEVRRLVGSLIEFPVKNSGISIQHGSQWNGIGRGTTPSAFHLSELSEFENPEDLVDASLLRAAHSNPSMFGMLESTAKGRRNWWHKTWEAAKEDWPAGRSRMRPVFLPWFVGTDLYPTDTYMVDCPPQIGWRPLDVTLQHAKKCEQFVQNNELLSKYLGGSKFRMPRQQMWYYENERETARKKKQLNQFLAEMPGDDLEAFSSTNISAFDAEIIQLYHDNVRDPLDILGIKGPDIPQKIQPGFNLVDETRVKTETISITAEWSPMVKPQQFTLLPLYRTGYGASMDFSHKIFIWEWPLEGEEYVLGVDTGDGIGADRSVVEVIRKGTAYRNDEQVAEFASAYINAYDFWAICMALGTLYTVPRDGGLRQPKIVAEVNRNGESVQLELRKRGWGNFHIWVRYDSKKMNQAQSTKLGWVTNSWSRPMCLDMLLKYIDAGWVNINSPWFVDEMSDLERSWDQQDLKAIHGGHDDRIMAMAIALFSAHVLEMRPGQRQIAEIRSASHSVNKRGATEEEYARYLPGIGELDEPGVMPVHQILGEAERWESNLYSDEYDM